MTDRVAFITGVTGQDGALLSSMLLERGYLVHGLKRPTSQPGTSRIADLMAAHPAGRFVLHEGDMTDSGSLERALDAARPDEIYNLAAQSHVHTSFATPQFTADVNGLGVVRLLEAVRRLRLEGVRFYQASTSELFGDAPPPQNEDTPFRPRSPYAISKLYGYWIVRNYREAYDLHASNGILFNHESPLRGEAFVTRKITRAVAAIHSGSTEPLHLGNLDARRDWGHARDYVKGMWQMLQQTEPDDFVLATGATHSVREFAERAFGCAGIEIHWQGAGANEVGVDETGRTLVKVDPRYFRPTEVANLVGDASKAKEILGWRPTVSFEDLVGEMVESDCRG